LNLSKDQGGEFSLHPEAVEVKGGDEALAVHKKKTWSELDKYIELLLDSKQTDQSVFVYLNPSPDGNPYDLTVC